MNAHTLEPPRRPYRIHHTRTWRVTGAVLLAHATVLWILGSGLLTSTPPREEIDHVIMASVVMDMPAPPAPAPQPVVSKVQLKPLPQPIQQVVSPPQPQPSPLVTTAAPSKNAPVVAAAPPSENAPVVAAAPPSPASALQAAGNQRPNVPQTAAATVALPSSDADYLNNPPPTYPRMSRRMGEQGTVVVRVLINVEGRAERAELRASSGYSRLDEAALETVKRWRYVPGNRAGMPEAMWFNVPIRFVLD